MTDFDPKEFERMYYKRPIRMTFPQDMHNWPDAETTRADLLRLARSLAEDPSVRTIFERVDLHDQMTWQEIYQVDDKLIELSPYLPRDTVGFGNILASIALARRFVSGVSDINDAEAAALFITERTRFDAGRHDPIFGFCEAYQIYKNFLKRPDLIQPFEVIRARQLAADEHFFKDEDEEDQVCGPILNFIQQQLEMYAAQWRKRSGGVSGIIGFMGRYAKNEFDSLEPADVKEELRKKFCEVYHIFDDSKDC